MRREPEQCTRRGMKTSYELQQQQVIIGPTICVIFPQSQGFHRFTLRLNSGFLSIQVNNYYNGDRTVGIILLLITYVTNKYSVN